MKHPRDRFLTVYGRKPVFELLQTPNLQVDKLMLATNAKGELIKEILDLCKAQDIVPLRATAEQVSRISKNPKQDQGVAVDVVVENMDEWGNFLTENAQNHSRLGVVAIDGVTTPANVGMIIRTCTALGLSGILLPRKGTSDINSLVIKASAGVIFRSRLLKCETLAPSLRLAKEAGYIIYALDAGAKSVDIFKLGEFAEKAIFVMGNETNGISPAVALLVDIWLRIPMYNGVESLNVATAAAILSAEWQRRNG
jgi:23S rRNA (guanosine2251-2'-O)-methyltransferase